jgi:hypothetical protein
MLDLLNFPDAGALRNKYGVVRGEHYCRSTP